GNEQMVFIGRQQDLFRMVELQIQLGKGLFHGRLNAYPDSPRRQGLRRLIEDVGPRAADFFEVIGQRHGGLSRTRRSAGEDDDRRRRLSVFDQDQLGSRQRMSGQQEDNRGIKFHGRSPS